MKEDAARPGGENNDGEVACEVFATLLVSFVAVGLLSNAFLWAFLHHLWWPLLVLVATAWMAANGVIALFTPLFLTASCFSRNCNGFIVWMFLNVGLQFGVVCMDRCAGACDADRVRPLAGGRICPVGFQPLASPWPACKCECWPLGADSVWPGEA